MDALLFRMRVAVLWVAVAVAVTGSLLLYLLEPGALEEVLAGEMEGEALTSGMGFFMAALGIIPLVMAGVTLLIIDRVSRWVNLIAGLAFGLFGVFAVVSHLSAGDFTAHVLLAGLAGALAFVIAGLGLIGLRQTTSESAASVSEASRYHRPTTA
jgi:hypothetical protein